MKRNPKKLAIITLWYDDRTISSQDTPWGKKARSWNFKRYPLMGATYTMREWVPEKNILMVIVIPLWIVKQPKDQIAKYSKVIFTLFLHELVHGFLNIRSERLTEQITDEILEKLEDDIRFL